ncbi:MAG: RagB/SusD family nutrient uptake outer membrane protein [Paludibacteraceae bacterium]|nr:RagB/SusD family nutrient uptake outer membrane protein [Paludibacteraceae bacterium]
MKKNTLYIIIALACAGLTGCKDSFLDKNPDMRATIDTKEKVRLLLVSAYSDANTGPLMEYSSDNIVDNNAPDASGHTKSLVPLDKMYDEIFAWEPVVSSGAQDSPKHLWNGHYSAIAACNQALKAIAELEAKGINMSAEKGEALLSRAYHHFLLTCVFCQAYKGAQTSSQDLGLVYMTEPETSVKPVYHRETLDKTYAHIEADLEAGLKLVSDEYYTVPKYHFNVKAAHAFAARFYLYKRDWDKVIEHADFVLGTNPDMTRAMLFDNYNAHVTCTDFEQESYAWIDPNSPSNLLIMTHMSSEPYTSYPSYARYQCAGDALDYSLLSAGPIWKKRALIASLSVWSFGSDHYGSFLAKHADFFEFTDKVNGYGYIHAITRQLTTNETLLCRAEAKVMKNNLSGAVEDLRTWCLAYDINDRPTMDTMMIGDSVVRANLTQEKIKMFYSNSYGLDHNAVVLHPEGETAEGKAFTIDSKLLPFVRCCLHFRRIETVHDGWRWMDLKRYGIEITHKSASWKEQTLTYDDPRWAIQLPQEVILAGLEANPRIDQSSSGQGASVLVPGNTEPKPIIKPIFGGTLSRLTE